MRTDTAVVSLLGAADPALIPPLLTRSPRARTGVAEANVLPAALVDAVLTGNDAELRVATVRNPAFVRDHQERAVALAGTGDPRVGTVLLCRNNAGEQVQQAVLAAIDPGDPGWRAPDGLVSLVVGLTSPVVRSADGRLRDKLAGRTPFEEIDRAYLRKRSHTPDALRVVGNLWRRHGRTEVAESLAEGRLDPFVAELVTAALADPLPDTAEQTAWDRQLDALRSPQWSVRMLRLADKWRHPLPADHQIDWPAVLAAHAEQPFDTSRYGEHAALRSLVTRDDCPDEFLLAIADRQLLRLLVHCETGVSLAVLTACVRAPRGSGDTDGALADVVATGLEQGTLTIDQVLEILTPLSTLCGVVSRQDGVLRDAVGARVTAALGSDPGAWRALWKLLPRWRKPLDDLLTAAVEAAGRTPEWVDRRWAPTPGPAQWMDAPGMTERRIALDTLLTACPVRIQLDVLPVLDELAAFDLLARGPVEPALFTGVLDRADRRDLRLLAANRELSDEQKAQLLALGDPDVHAQLFFQLGSTHPDRHDIVAGRRGLRRLNGDRPDAAGPEAATSTGARTEPTDQASAAPDRIRMGTLLREFFFDSKRQWQTMLPLIGSGEADVAVELLRTIKVPTGLLQLRLVLAVAERDGVPAARQVLDTDLSDRRYKARGWDRDARQAAQAVLSPTEADDDDSDGDALRRLAAVVTEWSSPARWIERLRGLKTVSETDKLTLNAERYAVDWVLLQQEHEQQPFSHGVLMYLENLPGCPLLERTGAEHNPWEYLDKAITAGEATLAAVVADQRPAAQLLSRGAWYGWWQRSDNPLPKLCEDHLGDRLDAWHLAFELINEFSGTLPELLAAAGTATATAPVASQAG